MRDESNHIISFPLSALMIKTVLIMFTATLMRMQMEMKNVQTTLQSLLMQLGELIALPLRLSAYLITTVIELMINIPVMNAVWRERRELELLTDAHIKDLGLTPDQVRKEINRRFFDIPAQRKIHWNAEDGLNVRRQAIATEQKCF